MTSGGTEAGNRLARVTDLHPRWWGLWPAVALSLLFAGCLVYAAWPGNLVYPEVAARAEPVPLADSVELKQSLEAHVARLKDELGKNACEVDAAIIGPALQWPAAPDITGALTPPPAGSTRALLASLDAATVLVLAQGDSISTGSGFFVGPHTILTNRHVVNGAGDAVFVASKAIGRALRARVVAASPQSEAGGADFALLQVEGDIGHAAPLALSTRVDRMNPVIAGGFPASVMSMDNDYRALLGGDDSRVEGLEMTVTQGAVMAMPTVGPSRLITHSASISPGNSGGPLADVCGRAVGINTFIRISEETVEKLNYSLTAADAIRFLSENGVLVAPVDETCEFRRDVGGEVVEERP